MHEKKDKQFQCRVCTQGICANWHRCLECSMIHTRCIYMLMSSHSSPRRRKKLKKRKFCQRCEEKHPRSKACADKSKDWLEVMIGLP